MQKVKIIVRKYEKKAGGTFVKLSIGGKFVPDVLADDNTSYQVKFTSKSLVKEPTEEGIYEVAYEEDGLWIDTRPELSGNIVRINAVKTKFYRNLPKLDKDVRLQ